MPTHSGTHKNAEGQDVPHVGLTSIVKDKKLHAEAQKELRRRGTNNL